MSLAARNQLEELEPRLDDLANALQTDLHSSETLNQLNEKVGDSSSFRQALSDYSDTFPAASRSKDFKRDLRGKYRFGKQLTSIPALADSWHKTDQQHISPSAALTLISEATNILNNNPTFQTLSRTAIVFHF